MIKVPTLHLGLRNWLLVVGAMLAAALVALAIFVVIDGARARTDNTRRAQADAARSIDIRMAQSRRIDLLEARIERQSRSLGAALEALEAVRGQLLAMDVEPVADGRSNSEPAARPTPKPTRVARPRPAERPTARPSPTRTSSPRPSPRPSPSPSPSCLRLPIVGCP